MIISWIRGLQPEFAAAALRCYLELNSWVRMKVNDPHHMIFVGSRLDPRFLATKLETWTHAVAFQGRLLSSATW